MSFDTPFPMASLNWDIHFFLVGHPIFFTIANFWMDYEMIEFG